MLGSETPSVSGKGRQVQWLKRRSVSQRQETRRTVGAVGWGEGKALWAGRGWWAAGADDWRRWSSKPVGETGDPGQGHGRPGG